MRHRWIHYAVAVLRGCDTSVWRGIWHESMLRSLVCLSSRGQA